MLFLPNNNKFNYKKLKNNKLKTFYYSILNIQFLKNLEI